MDHKVKLKSLLDDALDVETLEVAFCGFLKKTDADDENVNKSFVEAFKPFWATVPNTKKSRDEILTEFVAYIHQQKSLRRIDFCFEFLASLVSNNVIPARLVCEAILNSKNLQFKDEVTWCKSFQLIHKIVGGTDYKGCGGVLSLIFTNFNSIPKEPDPAYSDRIQHALKVIQYIFDRKACLLPAYFVISEIYNHFPEVQEPQAFPHWSISKLLSSYVDSFRPLAHIVSITGRSSLLPIIGHPGSSLSIWKLDPATRSFPVKGSLPYDRDLLEPQDKLLQYVIGQPYSREIVCTLLGLIKTHKQRCPALEQLLVDLIVIAMEKTENNPSDIGASGCQLLWHHLSSHLIFFVLFQFASFPHMVTALYDKLSERPLKKGRNHLMWVLLQFISGSIQKNPLSDFKPVLRLFELLYPESEPLPEPDINSPDSVHSLAMASIWIHLTKKAELEKLTIKSPTSHILKKQLEFIHEWSTNKSSPYSMNNYAIPILCNAYSTIPARFTVAMTVLVEMCFGNGKVTTSLPGPSNTLASGPTIPCPMRLLDSLTVHAKMSLIHSIFSRIMKLGTSSANLALAPALVETYSRLLVYMEIESLGIKGIISHLLPTVFKNHAWGILHTLLEMFSYRLHHVQAGYRVTLLSHLHSIASVPHTNQNQLQLCVESTALRLITGLGSTEVQTQLTSRFSTEPKQILSPESEELNRALVLTIARSMHVTGAESCGNWCEFILRYLVSSTPHSWASHTLACFPQPLQEFYNQNPCRVETKQALKTRVEDEYRRWKGMTSENDILSHFAEPSSSNVFICILWKLLLETGRLSSACHKVLERLGARALSSHIRVFADFLVYEFSTSGGGRHVNKCIQHLNDLIWKYNVVTMDRLVLSLALRSHEGNEAQVCFFIIQLLLLKPPDFRTRVNAFVRDNSPHHWKQTDWHQKHMAYHTSYPERFYYEGLLEAAGGTVPTIQYLPVYFGNVCLRFLPVFDIVIHRFLELPPVFKSLESLLDHLGSLYKFHARPVTYLYNTLHYYEQSLLEKPTLKKKLVSAIIGAQRDIKPPGWCLSKGYLDYLYRSEDASWTPELSYYCYLIGRLVDTIAGSSPPPFPECDWRFNEFPNATAHALYVTAMEIMALPISPKHVGFNLFDVIYKGSPSHQQANFNIRANIMSWINAVAHVMTSLPDSYWSVIYEKICEVLKTDLSSRDVSAYPMMLEETNRPSPFPYSFFDFKVNIAMHSETHADYVLALTHAVWYHASIGQLTFMPHFIRTRVTPLVNNEAQLLYVCCLVGPFLQRFQLERTRCLQEIVVELYHLLEKVDRESQHLHHIETICDFLYHIKYMFIGDLVRDEVQKVIPKLRQSLQVRLRFMLQTIKREETSETS